MRPRSMTPFSIGSGGSGISTSLSAASSTRAAISGICSGGAKIRSIGSSMSFSIGSSVTTQVCPTRARIRPSTWKRPPLIGVTSSDACAARISRKPPTSAMASRVGLVGLDVAMQSGLGDLHHGDGNAPGIGLVGQGGRSVHGLPCLPFLAVSACLRRRGEFPRSAQQRRFVQSREVRKRRLGIDGQLPGLVDVLAVQDILAQRPRQRLPARAPARGRRPPHGRRTPPRRPACASGR